MSEKNDGGAAFPALEKFQIYDDDKGCYRDVYQPVGGMSLRDYFAARALGGIIASYTGEDLPLPQDNAAAMRAYAYADAMLAERVK